MPQKAVILRVLGQQEFFWNREDCELLIQASKHRVRTPDFLPFATRGQELIKDVKVPLAGISIRDSALFQQIPVHICARNRSIALEQNTDEFSLRMRMSKFGPWSDRGSSDSIRQMLTKRLELLFRRV